MIPEKQISDFVNSLQTAAGENLQSVILYGSAASGEFNPEFSNINLLCILRETSFAALAAIAPAVERWSAGKRPAPLVFTRDEMERSADVFVIEFLDMRENHRVLLGEDVLKSLPIKMTLHRAQLEYEMREKLILLRERLLLASGQESRLWELLHHSLPAFATLFRHTLIALGSAAPKSTREAVQALAARVSFDPSAFLQLLDIREHKADRRSFDVKEVFARYLSAIQQATLAVDTMLDSSGPHGS